MSTNPSMHIFASILFIVFGTIACQATPVPTPAETPGVKTTSEQPVRTEPESMPTDADESPADVVLGKAEQQRDAVQAVSATVAVERIEPLFNKREVRTGALLYERTTDASPRFSVLLDKRLIGRRLESRTKHIVYDGRWLSEIDHEKQQCIRWELCGDDSDPTRLDGRFPLPIGQPRDEVKQRFEAEVIEGGPEPSFLKSLTEGRTVTGLRLTPRAGAPAAKEFERVDVWYDTTTWLPLGVETIDLKSNVRRIRLNDVEINPTLTAEQNAVLQGTVPSDPGWMIDNRPCSPPPGSAP